LNKYETAEDGGSSSTQAKNSELEMNDEEWGQENGGDDSEDDTDEPQSVKLYGPGEYAKNKEKNIAELKTILAGLKIPDLAPKPAAKKPATKKKQPVEKRVSIRDKGKDK
jgi:hypothetical protein